MLVIKPERGPISDSDGTTGAHRLSGLAQWSMAVDLTRQRKRKTQPLMGVKGACPSGCLPHWGREGVTLAISTQTQKSRGDFSRAIFLSFYFLFELSVPTRHGGVPSGTAAFIIPDKRVSVSASDSGRKEMQKNGIPEKIFLSLLCNAVIYSNALSRSQLPHSE